MNIAMGQINSTIGDFSGNVQTMVDFSIKALAQGADMIVFPELALCGYPPMDLLEQKAFIRDNNTALDYLRKQLPPSLPALVGHVVLNPNVGGRGLQNIVSVLWKGEIVHQQAKTLLPTYDVFDETRYFEPADERLVWTYMGMRMGIAICEDIWEKNENGVSYTGDPLSNFIDQGAQLLLVPSASPFYAGKLDVRKRLIRRIGKTGGLPVVYVNMVGANDALIFDGRSLISDSQGNVRAMCKGFQEELLVLHLPDLSEQPVQIISQSWEKYEEIRQALCLGIRDYLAKTGFDQVHLGLSGGVDSALVLCLAVQALGTERVRAIMLPSRYSSPGSIKDSERLCNNLGIDPDVIDIDPVHRSFELALNAYFADTQPDSTEENIQARIRGNLLMAWSNKFNSLLLSTGNKSELGVGYCTLYGDMSGALAVIGDLFKTEVYELCWHINQRNNVIPEEILNKSPSAELRPDQKDADSLPSYEILDEILQQHVLEDRIEISEHDSDLERRIIAMVQRAEYKRYQGPPVLKVSPKAFGLGRRMPIARK